MNFPPGAVPFANNIGPEGPPGTIHAGTVTMIPAGEKPYVVMRQDTTHRTFADFFLPRGLPGVNAVPTAEAITAILTGEDTTAHAALVSMIHDALQRVPDPVRSLQWRTVSVSLDASTPMTTYQAELNRIKAHGGDVVLVILDYLNAPTGYTFTRVTQDRVDAWWAMADAAGVNVVMVKPHIVTFEQGDGFYRGNYIPASTNGFFANWATELGYFAGLCTAHGVPLLSVACEQIHQTAPEHFSRWQPIISNLRAANPLLRFTAAFTTAELFDLQKYHLPNRTPHMAQLLDVFGINSWVRLTNKVYNLAAPNITADELVSGWWLSAQGDTHMDRLIDVCTTLKIPYFVTEVGVRPYTDGLSIMEGGPTPTGAKSYEVQGLLYRSVLTGLTSSDWCVGVSIWHVREPFNYFDLTNNVIYPGEQVIREFFQGA